MSLANPNFFHRFIHWILARRRPRLRATKIAPGSIKLPRGPLGPHGPVPPQREEGPFDPEATILMNPLKQGPDDESA